MNLLFIEIIKLSMTNKRTEFLSRLLRITQLNEQLMELADKSSKQPAYAKKIKLVQMNPTNVNLPEPKNLPPNQEKIHGKIMVITKHSNHLNPVSSQRSEVLTAEQHRQKSSVSPVKIHEKQSNSLVQKKRASFLVEAKPNDEESHFSTSVTCEGRYLTRPDEICKRRPNNKDNMMQRRNQFDRKGQNSTKIFHQQSSMNAQNSSYVPAKSFQNFDRLENKQTPMIEIKIEREPKYFRSLRHINNSSNQKQIEQEKKNKLSLMKQINKNYAKPFIPPPKITAKSYIICQTKDDDDNFFKVVVSYNSKNSQEVASLTKIMTCIVIIQFCQANVLSFDEEVKIGKYQSSIGGTSANLRQGQIYTVKQLLYGLMLPSGNDASMALAVWCGKKLILLDRQQKFKQSQKNEMNTVNSLSSERIVKSECYSRFIKQMNLKAQSLKMNKTHYMNSHGLINVNNRSTAYDIAVLSSYAMKNHMFREIVSCKVFNCKIKFFSTQKIEQAKEEHDQASNTEPEDNILEDEVVQIDLKINLKDLNPQRTSRPATAKVESARSVFPLKHSVSKQCLKSALPFELDVQWQNTHKLLHSKPKEYLGIKTGITSNAGPCLSSCVVIENRKFLIVVLNCARINLRFKQTEILKKWLYKHEGLTKTVKKITTIKFTKSIKSMNNQGQQSQDGQQIQEDDIQQD